MTMNKAYLQYKIVFAVSIILLLIGIIEAIKVGSIIIIVLHVAFFGVCSLLYRRYGWNWIILDYVYNNGNLDEYLSLLLAKNSKKYASLIGTLSFLSPREMLRNNEQILFINVEQYVFGTSEESVNDIERMLVELNGSNNFFISNYSPILLDIYKEEYDSAVAKLDDLTSANNLYEIPRQFYLMQIFSKQNKYPEEVKSCIEFIKNKGFNTRYARYISCDNDLCYENNKRDCVQVERILIVFAYYMLWSVLLCLRV
ncbi:MAG: hypothetical protein E7274_14090 [Pseudobutyrivibrio ruminis]|uniref:hypothetical protein n=1 Tax=Pseudobutyrivibrio ruminis TaxID=46206 RepID=UPI0026EA26A4|nr:hypothetical protein [Pseudobutyrivibrio ruminis]MBE5915169.1 hypothetical protein [Pseudobutyrivibrio ruminis]